jgi:FtsX-like permease family
MADGLVGVLAAVVAGSVLAAVLAVAMSPLAPLGPIRQVYHPPGIAFDWTVLGLGVAALIGGLGAISTAIAYQGAAHRQAARSRMRLPRQSRAVHLATAMGLPITSAVGLRFALTSGQGRSAVPARSVLIGATLAIAMVTGTLTFSSGLRTLISHPALYGWNWNYALSGENGVPPAALTALDHDANVSGWSGYQSISVQIDNLTVPILAVDGYHATVAPPILSGHGVDAHNQIDISATTLALVHKQIGDTVKFSFGSLNTAPLYLPPTKLVIVGTATFPAIGGEANFADHPSMGTGALLSAKLSSAFVQATSNPDPNLGGPGLVFVRLRSDVSPATGLSNMNRITAVADAVFAKDRNAYGDTVNVLSVQRPAEIVNYQSTGATPVVLAIGLAVGAILALALTLVASVRRRRRDLALLKTLGFTARQLAAAIAWQASTIATISAALGIPIGIIAGRQLWDLFARDINAVPQSTVPASLILVALAALLLANLVAAAPARVAARTPAALVLRSELSAP